MKSLSLLRKTIAGGFRISAIAVLSACTTIHPETISQNLGPAAQEKFQRDFAECHKFAESKRPEISFKDDIAIPLGVALLSTIVGVIVESNSHGTRWLGGDRDYGDPKYGGKAIIGFSLAGVAAASGIVVARMVSARMTRMPPYEPAYMNAVILSHRPMDILFCSPNLRSCFRLRRLLHSRRRYARSPAQPTP